MKRIQRLVAPPASVDCARWMHPALEGGPHSVLPSPERELTDEQETARRLA
jgi:hypothetical protein